MKLAPVPKKNGQALELFGEGGHEQQHTQAMVDRSDCQQKKMAPRENVLVRCTFEPGKSRSWWEQGGGSFSFGGNRA